MLSKTDFSSANLLVVDDRISCIYDFDTAHRVNRVLFLGNCLKNCFHPTIPRLLDWRLVKESLSASSDALPPDEVLCGASLFDLLDTTLERLDRSGAPVISWPTADQFEHMARDRIGQILSVSG
jgi:hypothetical protein